MIVRECQDWKSMLRSLAFQTDLMAVWRCMFLYKAIPLDNSPWSLHWIAPWFVAKQFQSNGKIFLKQCSKHLADLYFILHNLGTSESFQVYGCNLMYEFDRLLFYFKCT